MSALLERALDKVEEALLLGHIDDCAACRREYESLRSIRADLEGLGASRAPAQVDLIAGVLEGVARIREQEDTDAEAVAAMAYLDGELDELGQARFERRLVTRPELQAELNHLAGIEKELEALAGHFYAPGVDLCDAVMAAKARLDEDEGASPPVPQLPVALMADLDAYMEDTLDATGFDRLLRAVASDPRVRAEYEALCALKAGLDTLGKSIAAKTPQIEITGAVMRSVHATKRGKIVPLQSQAKAQAKHPSTKRPPRTIYWMAGAAAALLAVLLGALLTPGLLENGREDLLIAQDNPPLLNGTNSPESMGVRPIDSLIDADTNAPNIEIEAPPEHDSIQPPENAPEPSAPKALSLKDMIRARREAVLKDADALSRLAQWASLTPEEARALLEDSGLTPEAILGAIQFLPPDEAASILLAALEQNPDDPYLRYALAKTGMLSGDKAYENLNAWESSDPENSLPLFMEARLRFAKGDFENALNALANGIAYDGASSYVLESTRQHAEALIASGMTPDMARYLAVSSAGNNEHQQLTQLGRELLAYGDLYKDQGNYTGAEQVYNAVLSLGTQITQNAFYASEQRIGMDTQMAALDALSMLYETIMAPESLALIEAAFEGLLQGLNELTTFLTAYNHLLDAGHTGDGNLLSLVTELVLNGGDLNIFAGLSEQ